MDRRYFIQLLLASAISPFISVPCGWAYSNGKDNTNGKRLIVVLLRGGVDGLNVVVPYGDSNYRRLRPTIAITQPGTASGVINLDGYFGLHPALAPLMPFWNDHSLAFVHSSGSPDPTRSHFDAQAYMETGTPGNKSVATGWLNRLIKELPSAHSPVEAVSIGSVLPLMCAGPSTVATVNDLSRGPHMMPIDRPILSNAFSAMYTGRSDDVGQAFNEGMSAHRTIEQDLQSLPAASSGDQAAMSREQIIANHGAPIISNKSTFGSQVANLLNKEASMQVVFLDFGGWDTHVSQGNGQGQLANHLQPLASGLAELVSGLGPLYKNTTIIVMSEFGRTAAENGNRGTDHGHGNVMWLLGGGVQGGKIYARWAGLAPGQLHEQRDLQTTTDFRNVIASTLHNHFDVSRAGLTRVFPDFQPDLYPFVAT
jgi:uncharacterized protein (DUF1501 family)